MAYTRVIARVRSGLAQILYERGGRKVGSGSAFLVRGGLVTNSHVIRPGEIDAILIRMADTDPQDPEIYIRLLPEACYQAVTHESPADLYDYAFLGLDEPEFAGRYRFTFDPDMAPVVGEEVAFLDSPLGWPS